MCAQGVLDRPARKTFWRSATSWLAFLTTIGHCPPILCRVGAWEMERNTPAEPQQLDGKGQVQQEAGGGRRQRKGQEAGAEARRRPG
eukprot:5608579-Pyramimonas_sp.AAC.1